MSTISSADDDDNDDDNDDYLYYRNEVYVLCDSLGLTYG